VRIRDLVPAPPLPARMRGSLQSLMRTSALGAARLSGRSSAPVPPAPFSADAGAVAVQLRVAERDGSVTVRLLPAGEARSAPAAAVRDRADRVGSDTPTPVVALSHCAAAPPAWAGQCVALQQSRPCAHTAACGACTEAVIRSVQTSRRPAGCWRAPTRIGMVALSLWCAGATGEDERAAARAERIPGQRARLGGCAARPPMRRRARRAAPCAQGGPLGVQCSAAEPGALRRGMRAQGACRVLEQVPGSLTGRELVCGMHRACAFFVQNE